METKDLPSYIPGYDDYCEPEEVKEDIDNMIDNIVDDIIPEKESE